MSTGDALLVEASPTDRIWGIGMDARAEGASVPSQWRGSNVLGWALMEVRKTLRLEHTDLVVMAATEPELVATESMAAMESDSDNSGDGIDALGRMSEG